MLVFTEAAKRSDLIGKCMIDYFVRALPLIIISVGVSLIPVSGFIVWESINRFQFQLAHLTLIPAQNPVDFIFAMLIFTVNAIMASTADFSPLHDL